ncbi:MAG: DUF2252 domain-containing protein [Deltaproteobacteria bacterium]|nr:DUF2252 domain-containing protein [Deltaproteobacteria bacterium]
MAVAPPRWAPQAERIAYGKSLRDVVRRVDHDKWVSGPRDPIARLQASERGRIPEMLAVRYQKLSTGPFAYLRGNAWVMAPDLAQLPVTGYEVQICGDAHVRNLGAYAAQDGHIVFDVNDFDETCRAPFEWELTRLAISIAVVGREGGSSDSVARDAVRAMVRMWRDTMTTISELPAVELARYCVHRFDTTDAVGRVIRHAERETSVAAVEELTDGSRFVERPGKLRRVPDEEAARVLASLAGYRDTLGPNRQQVLDCYEPYDVAFKIAGTGSVGAKNYIVLCRGNGPEDPLLLQVKEALPSCYAALGLVEVAAGVHEGKRVAEGQHRMQTWTDPFLGWTRLDDRPCYVRQVADHQSSIDPKELRRGALVAYANVCGETFAKAHARTGDPCVLAGYAGRAEKLDDALAERAIAGANQVEADWKELCTALTRGVLHR